MRATVGIPKTRLTERRKKIHFATHASTSSDRRIAKRFVGKGGGMVIEIQNTPPVSFGGDLFKYPDEHKTLSFGGHYLDVDSVTIGKGEIQHVVLKDWKGLATCDLWLANPGLGDWYKAMEERSFCPEWC